MKKNAIKPIYQLSIIHELSAYSYVVKAGVSEENMILTAERIFCESEGVKDVKVYKDDKVLFRAARG